MNTKNLTKYHLLFTQTFNVSYKILMDVKIIVKIHLEQKQVNIFQQIFQCLQYHHLKA